MKMFGRSTILAVAVLFAFAMAAKADNIHLCTSASNCPANSNNIITIATGTTTAFVGGNPDNLELFLAILQPVAGTSGNWNSGTLWSVLGVPGGSTYPTLSSAISQEQIGTGITAQSFNVSSLDLGTTWTTNPQQITLPNDPLGTIFLVYTTSPGGSLALVSPWSSSLANGGVTGAPEPSSMLMVGLGLAFVLALKKVLA